MSGERQYIPLFEKEQKARRPLQVGILLSGTSKPIKLKEKLSKMKIRRTTLGRKISTECVTK